MSGGDAYGESSFGKPAFGAQDVSQYGQEADQYDNGYGQEADYDIGYGQEVDFGQDIGYGGSDYGQDDTYNADIGDDDFGYDDYDYGLDAIVDFDGVDTYGQ